MPTYNSYNDQELTAFFSAGDDAAFKEIYLRYDKLLYLYAYHKLGDKEESRDVVQDVFAWLLSNRKTLHFTGSLSGYLYKSVLNKIYNIYKHKQVLNKYAEEGNFYVDLESEGTDFMIREKDIAAMIDKTIAEMPPRMREIYELRCKRYMTAKEIADHTGVAESTVNTQLKRAVKHLKLKLGLLVLIALIMNS